MSKSPTLSVVIITLNEERNIARCLKSLRFSKKVFSSVETIVVDAQSQDKTVGVAKQLGAKVFTRAWQGYGNQKNWALAKARGNWILSLDADEELTPKLISEIEKTVTQVPEGVDGYFIKRRAFFLGKWIRHCGWWPDAQLRLIKRGRGAFTIEPVHEGLEVKGNTLELDEPMNHYTYDSIRQYLDKMNRYSDLSIIEVKRKKIVFWKFYLTVAPFLTFFRMYISRRGFMDGWHGLVVCGLSAFHDFCKYAKLWEKEILKRSNYHG
ncbi:MAG TPA: glycosyltransferase family 2 protein [bacterium]|jgi:glycosyltransferase involved in cell wall biosynthesis|nr:glycosyltransferase family 2 protein [bacterium]